MAPGSSKKKKRVPVELACYGGEGRAVVACFAGGAPGKRLRRWKLQEESEETGAASLLSARGPQGTTWLGSSDETGYSSRASGRYVIGIRKGSKLLLVDAGRAFPMSAVHTSSAAASATSTDLKGAEARRALVQMFGSKKRQRKLRAALNSVVDTERVSASAALASQLVSRAEEAEETKGDASGSGGADALNAADMGALLETRRSYLPPFDMTTEDPMLIYPLSGIVSDRALEEMSLLVKGLVSAAKRLREGKATEEDNAMPAIARTTLLSLPPGKSEAKEQTLRLLSYLRILLLLGRAPNKLTDKKEAIATRLGVSPGLAHSLLTQFFVSDGRTYRRGRLQTNRLQMYTIALALHMTNNRLPIADLGAAMRLDTRKMRLLVTEMGCTIRKPSSKRQALEGGRAKRVDAARFASLKAPLTVRLPSKGGGKRGR